MNLLVISHKETWPDPAAPNGYATVGGFPFQMAAISSLFESTTLAVPIQASALPAGAIPLHGRNIRVLPLAEPAGLGLRRKLGMYATPFHEKTPARFFADLDTLAAAERRQLVREIRQDLLRFLDPDTLEVLARKDFSELLAAVQQAFRNTAGSSGGIR